MGANQNVQKLLSTGLVNTKDCYREAYNLDSAVFLSDDSAIAHKETMKIFLHSLHLLHKAVLHKEHLQ